MPSGLPSAIFESSKGTLGPSKVSVSLQRGFKVRLSVKFVDFQKTQSLVTFKVQILSDFLELRGYP